jgi:hypothetical protein
MVFLGQRASDRLGEAETLKFSQQMTFQLATAASAGCDQATHIAGSNDTPRGLGCRLCEQEGRNRPLQKT